MEGCLRIFFSPVGVFSGLMGKLFLKVDMLIFNEIVKESDALIERL